MDQTISPSNIPTNTTRPARMDVWIQPSETTVGLLVEHDESFDTHAALLWRAALAAHEAMISVPLGVHPCDAADAAIEAALFPAIPPVAHEFPVSTYLPTQSWHASVVADYNEDAVKLRVDRAADFLTPAWEVACDARSLLSREDFGSNTDMLKSFVRRVGLEELRFNALSNAHDMGGFMRATFPYANAEERAALKRWGLAVPESDPTSWVYFIRRGESGPFKIGWSRSPRARLAQLQTGQEVQLRLVAMAPGGSREESALHRRFAETRLVGEWFRSSPIICAYINTVNATGVL